MNKGWKFLSNAVGAGGAWGALLPSALQPLSVVALQLYAARAPFCEWLPLCSDTLLFHWCCKIIILFSCNNVHVYSTVSYEGAAVGHMATPCTLLVRGWCDSRRRAITHKLLFLKICVFCRSSWYFIYLFVPSHLSGGKQTLRVPQAELLNLPWLCFPYLKYIMFIAENQNVLT